MLCTQGFESPRCRFATAVSDGPLEADMGDATRETVCRGSLALCGVALGQSSDSSRAMRRDNPCGRLRIDSSRAHACLPQANAHSTILCMGSITSCEKCSLWIRGEVCLRPHLARTHACRALSKPLATAKKRCWREPPTVF